LIVLLDANVLIALLISNHVHHFAAEDWLGGTNHRFATCPITQGSLTRLLVREGQTAETAVALVSSINEDSRHEFWPDDLQYVEVRMKGIVGHRQVTDAYLAQLARKHGGRLATFDEGLASLHNDVAELVPVR
jgi:toxin-antitoxin system PIN domain toxin